MMSPPTEIIRHAALYGARCGGAPGPLVDPLPGLRVKLTIYKQLIAQVSSQHPQLWCLRLTGIFGQAGRVARRAATLGCIGSAQRIA